MIFLADTSKSTRKFCMSRAKPSAVLPPWVETGPVVAMVAWAIIITIAVVAVVLLLVGEVKRVVEVAAGTVVVSKSSIGCDSIGVDVKLLLQD